MPVITEVLLECHCNRNWKAKMPEDRIATLTNIWNAKKAGADKQTALLIITRSPHVRCKCGRKFFIIMHKPAQY